MQYVLSFLLGLLFISYFTLSHTLSPYPTSNIHYHISSPQLTFSSPIPCTLSHISYPHTRCSKLIFLVLSLTFHLSIPYLVLHIPFLIFHIAHPVSLALNSQNPQLPVNQWNQFPSELTFQISFRTRKKSLLKCEL